MDLKGRYGNPASLTTPVLLFECLHVLLIVASTSGLKCKVPVRLKCPAVTQPGSRAACVTPIHHKMLSRVARWRPLNYRVVTSICYFTQDNFVLKFFVSVVFFCAACLYSYNLKQRRHPESSLKTYVYLPTLNICMPCWAKYANYLTTMLNELLNNILPYKTLATHHLIARMLSGDEYFTIT